MFNLPSKSLRSQLLVSLVFGVVLILGVFWWLTQKSLHELSDRYVVTRLAHDSQSIEEHLIFAGDQWKLDHWSVGPIYLAENSGHYYQVISRDKTLSSPSLHNFRLQAPSDEQFGVQIYKSKGPVENVLLVRQEHKTINGHDLTIRVAENHDPIREVLLEFDSLFALLTIFTLLSIYGFQRWILNNTFARFKPLERKLQAFQKGQEIELRSQDYPQEIQSLVRSLQLTLNNSRQQFIRSRQMNSDLSHSLKTPLNLIFQLLESPELRQFPELQTALKTEAKRIHQKIEHELKVERFAQYQSIKSCEVMPVVLELKKSFAQLYMDKNLQMQIQVAEALSYPFEVEDAYELFGNLLDNACKWANSTVRLSADQQGFVIENDGQGVSAEVRDKLQQRGYRLDESMPGHGIGLSIVYRLVEAYGLEFSLADSTLGGLKVRVKIPE